MDAQYEQIYPIVFIILFVALIVAAWAYIKTRSSLIRAEQQLVPMPRKKYNTLKAYAVTWGRLIQDRYGEDPFDFEEDLNGEFTRARR